jgi:hypothetical protein
VNQGQITEVLNLRVYLTVSSGTMGLQARPSPVKAQKSGFRPASFLS